MDKQDLHLKVISEESGEIREGLMVCSRCHRYYPIIYGLPILTPDDYREKSLEYPVLRKWGVEVAETGPSFVLRNEFFPLPEK